MKKILLILISINLFNPVFSSVQQHTESEKESEAIKNNHLVASNQKLQKGQYICATTEQLQERGLKLSDFIRPKKGHKIIKACAYTVIE